jgi:hypothetical protein
MLILNKYFYKTNKSKLCIGDRVAVLNDIFYEYGGSKIYESCMLFCTSHYKKCSGENGIENGHLESYPIFKVKKRH